MSVACPHARLMAFINVSTTADAPGHGQQVWFAVGCKAPTSLSSAGQGATSRVAAVRRPGNRRRLQRAILGCNRFRQLPDNDRTVNTYQLAIKPGFTSFVWQRTDAACDCNSLWWAVHTLGSYIDSSGRAYALMRLELRHSVCALMMKLLRHTTCMHLNASNTSIPSSPPHLLCKRNAAKTYTRPPPDISSPYRQHHSHGHCAAAVLGLRNCTHKNTPDDDTLVGLAEHLMTQQAAIPAAGNCCGCVHHAANVRWCSRTPQGPACMPTLLGANKQHATSGTAGKRQSGWRALAIPQCNAAAAA